MEEEVSIFKKLDNIVENKGLELIKKDYEKLKKGFENKSLRTMGDPTEEEYMNYLNNQWNEVTDKNKNHYRNYYIADTGSILVSNFKDLAKNINLAFEKN